MQFQGFASLASQMEGTNPEQRKPPQAMLLWIGTCCLTALLCSPLDCVVSGIFCSSAFDMAECFLGLYCRQAVVVRKKLHVRTGSFSKCSGDCTTEGFSSTGHGPTIIRRKPECLCHLHSKFEKRSGHLLLTSRFGAGAIMNLVDHGRGHLARVIVQGTSENTMYFRTLVNAPCTLNLRFGPCKLYSPLRQPKMVVTWQIIFCACHWTFALSRYYRMLNLTEMLISASPGVFRTVGL